MDNMMFYYSGTGNSLYDAITIGKMLKNVKLISMRHLENNRMKVSDCQTLGFIFPVHHWGIPETVRKYIKKLSIHNVKYIYAVVTYSGKESNCLYDFGELLAEKGLQLDYSAYHKNVSSNITSTFATAYNISQNVKAEYELEKIVEDIAEHEKNSIPNQNILKEMPKHILYEHVNHRDNIDTKFVLSSTCDKCGLCKTICGRKNVAMNENGPEFLHKCDQCLACLQYCPKQAIDVQRITEDRRRYHHPFVSGSRIGKSELLILDGNIIEKID